MHRLIVLLVIFFTNCFTIYAQPVAKKQVGIFFVPPHVKHVDQLTEHYDDMTACEVLRVVDGDTFIAKFDDVLGLKLIEKIRIIGINTDEIHGEHQTSSFGILAAQFLEQNIANNILHLAFEKTIRDKYGRLLAYVFLSDKTCLNLKIVLEGYSYAYIKYPFIFKKDFIYAENYAKKNKKGIWSY